MRKAFLLITVILALYSTNIKAEDWSNISFYSNGKAYKLSDYKGKVVLVMFFATWCPYCKNELPALSMFKKLYQNNPDIRVLNISVDDTGEKTVRNYLDTYNLNNLDSYIDKDSNLLHSLGFSAIPTLILVSKEGKIIGNYSGLEDFDVEYIDRLIKEKKQAEE